MTTVESSTIAAFEYFAEDSSLLIIFHGNRKYRFLNVPQNLVNRFAKAKSFGQFFNKHIKDKFVYVKGN